MVRISLHDRHFFSMGAVNRFFNLPDIVTNYFFPSNSKTISMLLLTKLFFALIL